MTTKTLLILRRSTLAYVNFTKTFLKRMSLNQIRRGNRFYIVSLYQTLPLKVLIYVSEITEKDLMTALKSMLNGKYPGHNGSTKEFYEHFWDNLKLQYINSLKQPKINGNLSISQRQANIKLIAKKDRDKRFLKNWWPISLLNVDTKMLSKSLA